MCPSVVYFTLHPILITWFSHSLRCDICQTHFLSFANLYRHIMLTHNVKAFKCKSRACVESFESQQLLDEHFEVDHRYAQCPHCPTKVLSRYLVGHIKNRHEKENHVICETCGKVSLNKHMHLAHVKMDHDTRGKCQCDICGRWYVDGLVDALRMAESSIFHFFHRYKNLYTITAHLKRHSAPLACDICGKVLAHKQRLELHKRIHDPKYRERHKCTVCGKGFQFTKRLEVGTSEVPICRPTLTLTWSNHVFSFLGTYAHSYWHRWLVSLWSVWENLQIQLCVLRSPEEDAFENGINFQKKIRFVWIVTRKVQ